MVIEIGFMFLHKYVSLFFTYMFCVFMWKLNIKCNIKKVYQEHDYWHVYYLYFNIKIILNKF